MQSSPDNAFKALLSLFPDGVDMTSPETADAAGNALYGPLWEFEAKANGTLAAKYAYKVLTENYPYIKVSYKSVQNYLPLLSKLTPSVKKAILENEITLNEAYKYIQWLKEDEQNELAESAGTPEYALLLRRLLQSVKGKTGKYQKKPERRYMPYYTARQALLKARDLYNADKVSLPDFPETMQERNYRRKLESIIHEINVLEHMTWNDEE